MLIVEDADNMVNCVCGTTYTFNNNDLKMIMPGTFAVQCPNCHQLSYVVTEFKVKKYNEPIEVEGVVVDEDIQEAC